MPQLDPVQLRVRLPESLAEQVRARRQLSAPLVSGRVESDGGAFEIADEFVRELIEHRETDGKVVAVARDLDHRLHPLLPALQRKTHGVATFEIGWFVR